MKLYHGSNVVIKDIDLSKSLPNKDFGLAFYLSDNKEQAQEMATYKSNTFGGDVVVNEYECSDDILQDSSLNIKIFKEYDEEWARFIFANRDEENNEKIHNYDIVFGPIANDRVGRQIMNLKDGYISFEEFLHRLQYMKGITYQYAFCSEKAISKLSIR
ncbi:MAG: DUF3990 domain-containing protein [Bacteroidales bacterium]|nr:DUF3990 domain-containing protein [Bacteroidales bacterium]MCQ2960335.1 DUF3990 domain-containing protein [Bacteroidales bacterium]